MVLSGLQGLDGSDMRSTGVIGSAATTGFSPAFHDLNDINPNLVDAWSELAGTASEPNIFYEPWFLVPALENFDHHPELSLFLLWAGEAGQSRLLGLLPIGPEQRFSRWPIAHVQNWMHHNGFLGTPLVAPGFETAFWEHLLSALDASNWPGFLHVNGMTIGGPLDQALRELCSTRSRRCDLVHCEARALLQSELGAKAYLDATVRGKKRKELRRQARRLGEQGDVTYGHWQDSACLDQWLEEFLQLELSGWKGGNGSALASAPETRGFFEQIVTGAAAAGKLERRDIRLDGKPLAMLVNFVSAPGAFGFKTAFDENYARFSPGVLLQIENLKFLDHRPLEWIDSCAAQHHPMIDSLWSDRRHIGRFSIELKGISRRAIFHGTRRGEQLMAKLKGRTIIDPTRGQA